MKKAVYVILFLLAAVPSFAQKFFSASDKNYDEPHFQNTVGIEKGAHLMSGFAGGAASINEIDGVAWGQDGGLSIGAQMMSFPSEYLGVGMEAGWNSFFETTDDILYYYTDTYGYTHYDHMKIMASVLNLMFAARVNFNPQHRVRVYAPMGMGVGIAQFKTKLFGSNYTENSTGFAYYAGIGVEVSVTPRLVLGVETRYNGFNFEFEDGDKARPQYMTALFKVSAKF